MLPLKTDVAQSAELLKASCWEGQAHDCQTGKVIAVATSFDDSYLLSAAQDGTLYVHVSSVRKLS